MATNKTPLLAHLFPLLLGAAGLGAQERVLIPADLPARATAGSEIRNLLAKRSAAKEATVAERLQMLISGSEGIVTLLPEGSFARTRIEKARATATTEPIASQPRAERGLITTLEDTAEDLLFRPTKEAEVPAGFPAYRAVGELEILEYPRYRMAKSPMRGAAMLPFWTLFQHIQQNEIAMTAPVQIDYKRESRSSPPSEGLAEQSMAFLYSDTAIGTPGKAGRVEVVDVPETTVLSIGARGYDSKDRVAELGARLEAWLERNHGSWQSAGALRVMGYNSPSVGGDRRYFEVQIPIAPVPKPNSAGRKAI